MCSLTKCESEISGAEFLQLHYDGRIIDGMDRFVFLNQYYCESRGAKIERVAG